MFENLETLYFLYCFYRDGDLYEIDASINAKNRCEKLMQYGYVDKQSGIYFITPKGKQIVPTIDKYIESFMKVD